MSGIDLKTSVTILGSGTCVPSLRRNASSVFVKTEKQQILLDMGPGTLRRLLESGGHIHEVTYLLVTHFHPDHSADLVPFLFSSKYPESRRREKPLTLIGGPGLKAFFAGLIGVYGDWIALDAKTFELVEMDTNASMLPLEGLLLSTVGTAHRPESLAFRIQDSHGKTVVFSGDTDECDTLKALAKDADLLICEASMPHAQKVAGHLTPFLAGRIAADAHVRSLVLTHFYPECDASDAWDECRSVYSGPLALAEDLMRLELE